MIRATETDRAEITAFLQTHIATSMFPLSNLRRHGMAGGHPRAMNFWLRRRDGAVTDVLGQTEDGLVFPQCPNGDWSAVADVLVGRAVKGILGDKGQVRDLRRALELPNVSAGVDEEEPLYQLSLADLVLPETAGYALRPLSAAPFDLVLEWRAAYLREVLPIPGEDVIATARTDIAGYQQADSHRVLFAHGLPVAMTGFNAQLPDVVQIGGVYTPPALRGQGYARRAVALHLEQARAAGVRDAILFAASPQACRAYEAVGFRRTGAFSMLILEKPQVIHA